MRAFIVLLDHPFRVELCSSVTSVVEFWEQGLLCKGLRFSEKDWYYLQAQTDMPFYYPKLVVWIWSLIKNFEDIPPPIWYFDRNSSRKNRLPLALIIHGTLHERIVMCNVFFLFPNFKNFLNIKSRIIHEL